MEDYKGWKIPEKVIIVARKSRIWNHYKRVHEDSIQGFVVDSGNTKMLETARNWASWDEHIGKWDPDTRKYEQTIHHEGVEYEFTNDGFTLELLDSASGSSQGGKLSFWNCKISKDGCEFIIGIHSDYLLEVLKYNTFINGVCQNTLSFARCKGGVGMTTVNMPIYEQFLADEEKRKTVSKGKTKKRELGHLYSTLTGGNVYLGKFYKWYEPIYEKTYHYYYPKLVGFKKLDKPEVIHWDPWYQSEYTKLSDYFKRGVYFSRAIPARTDSGKVVEIDMTPEEIVEGTLKYRFEDSKNSVSNCENYIGISTSDAEYELPAFLRERIIKERLTIEDK